MPTLEISHVTHNYKKNCALVNVSAKLANGVVALVGPNGAGKTTLINIIVGLLAPSDGQILFNGTPIQNIGKSYYSQIGYCPQAPHFYKNFTAREFLLYMGAMKEIKKNTLVQRTEELLEIVNLLPQKNQMIGTFSGGMKQRLGIAQALLNDPKLLILDEPTAGLDPSERIRFRNLLARISKDRIVLLATHIISDVESISNQILLLKQGRLIVNDTPEAVLEQLKKNVWNIHNISEKELVAYQGQFLVSGVRKADEQHYDIKLISGEQPSPHAVMGIPGLEDAFLFYFHKEDFQ